MNVFSYAACVIASLARQLSCDNAPTRREVEQIGQLGDGEQAERDDGKQDVGAQDAERRD